MLTKHHSQDLNKQDIIMAIDRLVIEEKYNHNDDYVEIINGFKAEVDYLQVIGKITNDIHDNLVSHCTYKM
jgi:hypothetical protein